MVQWLRICLQCRGHEFPGLGTKTPHVLGQLNLRVTAGESALQEDPVQAEGKTKTQCSTFTETEAEVMPTQESWLLAPFQTPFLLDPSYQT